MRHSPPHPCLLSVYDVNSSRCITILCVVNKEFCVVSYVGFIFGSVELSEYQKGVGYSRQRSLPCTGLEYSANTQGVDCYQDGGVETEYEVVHAETSRCNTTNRFFLSKAPPPQGLLWHFICSVIQTGSQYPH